MCGICGEFRLGEGATSGERVIAMRDALVHRGPDADGLYLSQNRRLGLGFRRLAIIDLRREAEQPMANEDGSVRLVFNGEIYNFQDLRRELQGKGHVFRSRADSEVIVHLYEDGGSAALSRLDGMFALAIWDERRQRLVLARDRVGKKPLFYVHTRETFAFASEMKAFFRLGDLSLDIDAEAIPQYFIHGYVPCPRTFYKGVRQLEPGTVLTVEQDGRTTQNTYWHLNLQEASARGGTAPTEQEAIGTVRELMTRAVERRLVSDVPLGAFLSGGVDSTIVVGLMSRLMTTPVRTFSIGFEGDPAYDETSFAREVAQRFRTDHTEFKVAPSAIDLVDKLVWHHDGPFGDASAIPTYIISRLTKEHVTVVLTGDGGDELFAGYERFAAAVAADRVPRFLGRLIGKAFDYLPGPSHDKHWFTKGRRFARGVHLPLTERMTLWKSFFFDDLEALLEPEFAETLPVIDKLEYLDAELDRMRGLSTLATVLHANFRSYLLDDLLVKTDRCTMANSLEARSPFLDMGLVEYVNGLPDSMKLSGFTTKVILRKAFGDLMPHSVSTRRKMGFSVPLGTWFRTELRDLVQDVLLDSSARYRPYLSAQYVRRLVRQHQVGESNCGLRLWVILCFEIWLRNLPEWTSSSGPA